MSNNTKVVRNASRDALKYVYYVIIGIAITEALNRAFISNGHFLGLRMLERSHRIPLILIGAFLPTICRFVHGASIHLDTISSYRYKPIVDCIGFYLQAIFFYLMATSLQDPQTFSLSLTAMLILDALWLIFLNHVKYIEFDKTHSQWLISNFCLIAILLMLFINCTSFKIVWSFFIFLFAFLAAILDYSFNKDFYFPSSLS